MKYINPEGKIIDGYRLEDYIRLNKEHIHPIYYLHVYDNNMNEIFKEYFGFKEPSEGELLYIMEKYRNAMWCYEIKKLYTTDYVKSCE